MRFPRRFEFAFGSRIEERCQCSAKKPQQPKQPPCKNGFPLHLCMIAELKGMMGVLMPLQNKRRCRGHFHDPPETPKLVVCAVLGVFGWNRDRAWHTLGLGTKFKPDVRPKIGSWLVFFSFQGGGARMSRFFTPPRDCREIVEIFRDFAPKCQNRAKSGQTVVKRGQKWRKPGEKRWLKVSKSS